MKFEHQSVMLNEVIDALNIRSQGIYLDCTLGGGGHSLKIGESLGAAQEKFSGLSCKVESFDSLQIGR